MEIGIGTVEIITLKQPNRAYVKAKVVSLDYLDKVKLG
jgi:hypothetical protein